MSQQNFGKSTLPDYPRAPTNDFDDNVLMQRPAPPSYDESQKQNGRMQPMHFQQAQPYAYAPAPAMYAPATAMYVPPTYGAPQYGAHGYHQTYALPASQQPPVLTLAQGAEIRTNSNGTVNIPPPPPGYAPTPAQWAAMQGQQIMVKEQKKRSFFS